METGEVSYDWTPASIATLRQLWDDGLTATEIGMRMGLNKNQVVGKAHRLQLPRRTSPRNVTLARQWTEADDVTLRQLYGGFMTAAEIGARMGRSKSAIAHRAANLGLVAERRALPKSRAVVARPAARARQELPCSVQRAASPSGVSPAVERQASSRPERNLPGAGADVAPRRVFSDKTCQFLHGETRGEYRFCEAPVVARDNGAASPFCAEHYALCLISHKKAEAARKAQREADTAAGRMRWQAPSAWR